MDSKSYEVYEISEKEHWWFKNRRNLISHIFWNNNTHSKIKNPDILSIGCGTGAELKYLSDFGTVTGLDISDQAIDFCQKKGYKVLKEDITKSSLSSESYDIIFAMDLLEHIEDDYKAYSEIIRLLRKGGYAIITVPALNFLWSKFDDFVHHYRRYSKKKLSSLLTSKDVKMSKLSYFNLPLVPVLLVFNAFKVSPESRFKVPKKHINQLVEKFFSFEKHYLNKWSLPIGSSLIAIVRKR